MAFPNYTEVNPFSVGGHGDDLEVGPRSAGDLVVAIFAVSSGGVASIAPLDGASWTKLAENPSGMTLSVWAVVAPSSSASSASCQVSLSDTNERFRALSTVVVGSDAHNSGLNAIAVSSFFSATTAFADPPSLNPGWGAEDILWIAATAYSGEGSISFYPPNYTDGVNRTGTDVSYAAAFRKLTASSENPGSFGLPGVTLWRAVTIAIRPSQNTPPTADAGPDQEVSVGDIVNLDGTGSHDAEDGTNLSYEWTVLDDGGTGLTDEDINNADTATPSFVAPELPDITDLASGGTITLEDGWRYHTFTSDGTFTANIDIPNAEWLIVAGGGPGGGGVTSNAGGGGGGGGGVVTGSGPLSAGTYGVTVGEGGVPHENNGENSSIDGVGTAIGGGHGARSGGSPYAPGNGGSGGGASPGVNGGNPGTGTAGQGHDGGGIGAGGTEASGGGGGAGAPGGDTGPNARDPGDGGDGIEWPPGSGNYYGGGGGGSNGTGGGGGFVSAGGLGGGGRGHSGTGNAEDGAPNTGGGGGGSRSGTPGSGGSGIVIVRYQAPEEAKITIQLKVTDSGGLTDTDTVVITVLGGPVRGQASIDATGTIASTAKVRARASATVLGEGDISASAKVGAKGAASVSGQGTISASGSRIRRYRPGQPLHWLGGPIDVRVEIDTGLTGATFGIWDQSLWGAATWGAQDPDWTDITEFVEQVTIDQGKERWEQRFGAGVAQIVLDNTRGYFTPEILGPFHLPFRPGRRIRVVAIPDPTADPHSEDYKVPLFTGTIDSSNDSYDEAGWNIRTVLNCVDFMALWQANNPPALENPTGVQSTDERVEAALDRVGVSGWPEDLRDIQEGLHTMQTSDLAQPTAEECHRAAEAEGGAFFCSKDGKATFKAREWLKGGVTEEDQVTETYTTSATWTVPADVFFVQVECWGGGGGGGAADAGPIGYPMGGGGGGGYARRTISVTPGETLTITVGKGGAGGVASAYSSGDPAYSGKPGGNTSVYRGSTRLIEAFGGREGSVAGGRGGGGYAPGGVVRNGGDGGSRHTASEGGGGGGGSAGGPSSAGLPGQDGGASNGGAGGANTSGGGAGGNGGNVGSTPEVTGGKPGSAPGGGGGGSGQDTTSDQGNGGAGADGQVVLTYTPTPAPTDPRSIQVQGYLGYDDSELPEDAVRAPVLDFRVSWEMARIRNDIQFSRVGGSVQHKWDDSSIAAFGRRSYRRLDLYNNSDEQVALLAERALAAWKDSRLRVDAVTIGANQDPLNEDRNRLLWDSQFGDLLAVKVKTPYGWEYEKEVHIMGIRHLITPNDWIVTFTLDDAATFQQEED